MMPKSGRECKSKRLIRALRRLHSAISGSRAPSRRRRYLKNAHVLIDSRRPSAPSTDSKTSVQYSSTHLYKLRKRLIICCDRPFTRLFRSISNCLYTSAENGSRASSSDITTSLDNVCRVSGPSGVVAAVDDVPVDDVAIDVVAVVWTWSFSDNNLWSRLTLCSSLRMARADWRAQSSPSMR